MGVHLDGSMGVAVSRLEVIEGPSGRRRRTKAERARIAAESMLPGVTVADVARKHGTKAEAALQRARGEAPCKPKRNRGHLPSHLPRIERVIEPASTLWSPLERHWTERQWRRGCGEMARIGEDVSERLDVIPAQSRVLITRRPKYACRRCSHAPEHVVPGGLPTELFIAVRHWARTNGASMAHHRLEVRGPPAVLPAG